MGIMLKYDQMRRVLAKCKAHKNYASDKSLFGLIDHWRIPGIDDKTKKGDCDDWAMRFAWELLQKGWSADKVLIALCELRSGQAHMVCLAEADAGHFVLDCRFTAPFPPRHPRLQITKWFGASELYKPTWRKISAPSGRLPHSVVDGKPNSEFLTFGDPIATHRKHLEWLERTAT